jgi:hypothetical protein
MPYVIIDDIIQWVPDGSGSTSVTAQDGTGDSFEPIMLTQWDTSAESANIVHNLIDGAIAVTLVGDRLRSGNITFLFDDDNEVEQARALLARPTSFALNDTIRPVVNMTFVRQGMLSPVVHDVVREMWEFTVGFQEVEP